MKILDRYLALQVLQSTGIVAVVVLALAFVAGFIGQADNLGQGSYGLPRVLEYVILNLPHDIYQVVPIIAFLGSLLALGGLAANSELVVMRGTGMSAARLAGGVLYAAIGMAFLTVLISEILGPGGVQAADSVRHQARHGDTIQALGNGLWLRNKADYIRISGTLPGHVLVGVEIYHVSPQGQLQAIVQAKQARYVNHQWQLHHVTTTRISTSGVKVHHADKQVRALGLAPSVLDLSVTQPDDLSSPGLIRYIHFLQRNQVAAASYRLALWRNLVTPFTVIVLMLFALPFSFGSLRSTGAGQRLFVGGLVGLVFYIVNQIVSTSGSIYGLPPWLSASALTIVLAVMAVWWLQRLQ